MESFSEDSFTWTDTSSDSSLSMTAGDGTDMQTEADTKHGKRKKSKQVATIYSNGLDNKHDSKPNIKVEKEQPHHEECNRKESLVKQEPESDCDVSKHKKKIKQKVVENNDEPQDYESYDENYLNLKVKQENMVAPAPSHKTKKKNKQKHLDAFDSNNSEINENEANSSTFEQDESQNDQGDSSSSKLKKKKKSKKKKSHEDNSEKEIDDEMDLDMSHTNHKSEATLNMKSDLFIENDSQEEINCSEISAIQVDDEHSPHSVSIGDSKTRKESNKEKKSLYKSTILNQFKMEHDSHVIQPINQTSPKISDRLMFEEDDDEDEKSITNKEYTSSKLRQFVKASNHLQMITKVLPQNLILSHDDDIWMLKCPKEIDIQDFYDIELNVDSKCKIKIGGQRYDMNIEEQHDTATVLSMNDSKYQIKSVPLSGRISIRKRIPKAHFSNNNIMTNNQTNFIPLPDTKCRHPLFGSNYKKALKIPKAIAERLKPNIEIEEISSEKHKKKKTNTEKTELESEKRKKKKRKLIEDEGPAPKRLKKIKHDPESAEAWDSERAIEQNLFDF